MNRKQPERIKQQPPISLEVTKLGHDGRGIAHLNALNNNRQLV